MYSGILDRTLHSRLVHRNGGAAEGSAADADGVAGDSSSAVVDGKRKENTKRKVIACVLMWFFSAMLFLAHPAFDTSIRSHTYTHTLTHARVRTHCLHTTTRHPRTTTVTTTTTTTTTHNRNQ
jgi:hypothetical protein